MRAVAMISGGVDSTTLVYHLRDQGYELVLVSFDYAQRHRRELAAAGRVARALEIPHRVVDISGVGRLLSGSALTDASVPVPEGHYTDASMRSTVVANRNAILLSIATGIAVSHGCELVAYAAHAGDHPIYPDCRPEFVRAMESALRLGNQGFASSEFRVYAPFLEKTKAEIVAIGARLGVPFEMTWSCYVGGERHCGRCGTCTERREAFQLAGVPDVTEYAA